MKLKGKQTPPKENVRTGYAIWEHYGKALSDSTFFKSYFSCWETELNSDDIILHPTRKEAEERKRHLSSLFERAKESDIFNNLGKEHRTRYEVVPISIIVKIGHVKKA